MPYAAFIGWSFLLAAISWIKPRYSTICGLVLVVSAVLFAGLRGASYDYGNYLEMFREMASSSLPFPIRLYVGKDPWFGALILALQSIGLRVQALFLISAGLALALKARAFNRVFGTYATPLLVTICTTYFLHEYTQIRVAIALGFAFLGLVALCERRKLLWGICSILAVGFHISALIVVMCELPFLLGVDGPVWLGVWGTAGLVTLAVLANVIADVSDVVTRVETYQSAASASNHAQAVVCFKVAVISVLTYFVLSVETDPIKRRLVKACYFMELIGGGVFFIFMVRAAGLGFRLMELLDAFSVFIITRALLRRNALSWTIAVSYCVAMIILVGFSDILVPYRFATQPFW